MDQHYDASHLQIQETADAIRKSPSAFVDVAGNKGLHYLLFEIVSNSIDEALAGFCTRIAVRIEKGGWLSVEDNGRGIPWDTHPRTGRSGVETVLTTLFCGGKFSGKSYTVSGGAYGMGASVVNALSESLEVVVRRDGKSYRQSFKAGKPVSEPALADDPGPSGTTVRFLPDRSIFRAGQVDHDIVRARLWEWSCLLPPLSLTLADEERASENETFRRETFNDGVQDYLAYCFGTQAFLLPQPIHLVRQLGNIRFEAGVQFFSHRFEQNIFSFVNTLKTTEGGAHVLAFCDAFTDAVIDEIKKHQDLLELPSQADVLEGVAALVSVYFPQPIFSNPFKTRLEGKDARETIYSLAVEEISTYLKTHPDVSRIVEEKCLNAQKIRDTARRVSRIQWPHPKKPGESHG